MGVLVRVFKVRTAQSVDARSIMRFGLLKYRYSALSLSIRSQYLRSASIGMAQSICNSVSTRVN